MKVGRSIYMDTKMKAGRGASVNCRNPNCRNDRNQRKVRIAETSLLYKASFAEMN